MTWVPRILHHIVNPLTTLPDPGVEDPLKYVIEGQQEKMSSCFMLDYKIVHLTHGQIIFSYYMFNRCSLQYDAMLQRFQSIGIHVAVSSISRGKTNCAKVALAAVGNYPKGYTIYLTDSLARSYLGGALPFVYDDPSSDRVLKPLLMNSFGGAEMGTQRQQFVARYTANEFILEDLARADKW